MKPWIHGSEFLSLVVARDLSLQWNQALRIPSELLGLSRNSSNILSHFIFITHLIGIKVE